MYLDVNNETIICAANCTFKDPYKNAEFPSVPPYALEISATSSNVGAYGTATPYILQLNQGTFSVNKGHTAPTYDINFDQDSHGNACTCAVAIGSGMLSLDSGNGGIPSTSDPTRTLGQSSYAPPTFANAATIGAPQNALTLDPNELGITVTTSGTASAPGASGLKLRVQCHGSGGSVDLVVLAGGSATPVTLASGVGSGVSGCL